MRPLLAALVATAALTPALRAADLGSRADAPLHAIQFVDRDEGWAVGDEGVVWHTIDSGKTWERQPSGVHASLRSLHFLNPFLGWIAGREELPHGAGSAGVVLFTRDGGLHWQCLTATTLPGLNRIHFLDTRTGFAAGDGSEQYPSGLFQTHDSGRTWQPVRGPRCTSWLAADFEDVSGGALGGAWNRLALVRGGAVATADLDLTALGGRNITSIQLLNKRGVAVGQGGLVLLCENTAERVWGVPDVGLPVAVRASWDFNAVSAWGTHIWVAGRPGSALLHSGNGGGTWETLPTGQPLPLRGLFFLDAEHGWAVGELGTILATQDGGKSWQVQHQGGQRAAVLFLHARPTGLPVDTVSVLGGEAGYLTVAVHVEGADPASSAPTRASDPQRFEAAMRQAGGAAGETLWQFPLPQHLVRAGKEDLLRTWDGMHDRRAAQQLLRQLVLALRIWRPEVVITDNPDPQVTGCPAEALLAEAVKEAFTRAADPNTAPEHLKQLGLQPWQASRLYACWHDRHGAQVGLDLTAPGARLEDCARDFAAPAAALLADAPPPLVSQRYFRLLASKEGDTAGRQDLVEGLNLPEGVARRRLPPLAAPAPAVVKAVETCRNLQALADLPPGGLTNPDQLLARIGPSLANVPQDQAARATFAIASAYARRGQWDLAREIYLLLVDRYPAHPLAAEAYRWLIRHNSSSEARRRHELGQFVLQTETRVQTTAPADHRSDQPGPGGKPPVQPTQAQLEQTWQLSLLGNREETRKWYQGCLDIEPRLAGFGPLFVTDPSVQFCLQAARRHLGDFETPKKWYARFVAEHPDGPWREAAATELWLTNQKGLPPRPVASCRATDTRPFLDGKLDEPCWTAHQPLVLRNAVGDTLKDYPTEVWLAYDKEYLYLALRCHHPADRHVDPVKVRPRDADVRPYDRVSLLLDLDRDYSTCFQLQVDQRGCVCEDCWGDLTWNPHWFVASHSEPDCWQVEAAIPMSELTGDPVSLGTTWACNVVRILPGRGVQAWSTPADVVPRPEGMGLLTFTQDPKPAEATGRAPVPMVKVP